MNVLVFGYKGFLGEKIAKYVASSAVKVKGFDLPEYDLTNIKHVMKIKQYVKDDTVIVFLSCIKREGGDNQENFLKNISMVANVCTMLKDKKFKKLIYFSSAAVYGEDINNECITEETPIKPTSYYGLAKATGEVLLRKAVSSDLIILRPATIYGPGEKNDSYSPSGFIKKVSRKEKIILWGDGTEKREFVYVDDVVRLVLTLCYRNFTGVLNVVTGESYSFLEIALLACNPDNNLISYRPRTKPAVNHHFYNRKIKEYGFEFTRLVDGMCWVIADVRKKD